MIMVTIKNEEKYKEACANYKPTGRKVKVRDMRPGYVYTFADCSIEDFIQYGPHTFPYTGCHWEMYKSGKESQHFLDNLALMRISNRPAHDEPGMVIVQLDPVYISDHYAKVLDRRCSCGWTIQKTGKKVWHPDTSLHYRIRRAMKPDDDIIEARPFRVGIYNGDNYEMELVPNPDTWVSVPANTPYTKEDKYVDVWDESDVKTIIVLSIISLVMLLGGPGAWGLIAVLWIFAALGFHKKHNEIREQVYEERRKRGVRGSGLDDNFRWRR